MVSVVLCVFTVAEVNYPRLSPQSQLAVFAMLGLVLCFLNRPLHPRLAAHRGALWLDRLAAVLTVVCCGFIIWQTEPAFEASWLTGRSLGNRAGYETAADTLVGILGLALVLEATRRSIGLTLPLLSAAFLVYGFTGSLLPDWLFPHRGYGVERLVAQTFLHTQGVFGVALSVMFTYVFLFVLFGAVLQATGATRCIVDVARRAFGGSLGGPAKVAVISSGLMGSMSGSAVANTATTGTFTIPLMRSTGFRPHIAAGIEAAASSGGALMPPIMGAGAYMMLEIVQPTVTYLEVIRAALLPAVLYYLSLFVIVDCYARRLAAESGSARGGAVPQAPPPDAPGGEPLRVEGAVVLTALGTLIGALAAGFTAFRAASLALLAMVVVSLAHRRTRLTIGRALEVMVSAARDVVPLVCAAACVGVVMGVVTLTGVGTRLPATILPIAEQSVLLALVLIMMSAIVLGMGLPSAVTYLLLATLMSPVLGALGVVPLSAHLFIFYFGMMSMVTPPVALAAYAASSIAGSRIMPTAMAAFRFALVGFTLPYIFVFRPELLMLAPSGGTAAAGDVAGAVLFATLGVVAFATGMGGYLFTALSPPVRGVLFVAAALLLAPGPALPVGGWQVPVIDTGGLALFGAVALGNWRRRRRAGLTPLPGRYRGLGESR